MTKPSLLLHKHKLGDSLNFSLENRASVTHFGEQVRSGFLDFLKVFMTPVCSKGEECEAINLAKSHSEKKIPSQAEARHLGITFCFILLFVLFCFSELFYTS